MTDKCDVKTVAFKPCIYCDRLTPSVHYRTVKVKETGHNTITPLYFHLECENRAFEEANDQTD